MSRNGSQTTSPRAVAGVLGDWWHAKGALYTKLAFALREAFARGEIATGTRLPAERTLAATLQVSRTTVVAAYELLSNERWLERRRGSGTWVVHPARAEPVPYTNDRARASIARNPLIRSALNGPGPTVDFSASRQASIGPLLGELMVEAAADVARLAAQSGYQLLGLQELRAAIAEHVGNTCGIVADPEQILVTTGSQQALWLLGQLYAPYGESVVLESPTYPGAIDAFRVLDARLHALPVDADGFHVAGIRSLLQTARPRLIVVAPTCQTPTGRLMTHEQRRALVEAAEEHRVTLVEDQTMRDLLLADSSPPAFAALSESAPVITVGSLSKLFWPGLRIGWIHAPRPIVEHLSRLKAVSDMGSSLVAEALAARLLAHADTVRELRLREISESLETLTAALTRHLPQWDWRPPGGGLSFWARLPTGNATQFAQIALLHGVTVTPGSALSVDGANDDHVRIQFVQHPDTIELGVRRLARAWRSYEGPGSSRFSTFPDGVRGSESRKE